MGEVLDTGRRTFNVLLQLSLLMHDDRCMALRGGSVIRNGMTSLLDMGGPVISRTRQRTCVSLPLALGHERSSTTVKVVSTFEALAG